MDLMDLSPSEIKFLRRQAQIEYWYRGDLSYILHKDAQMRVWNFINKWKEKNPFDPGPIVLEMHRGAGKTFVGLIIMLSFNLMKPYQTWRYGVESLTQAQEIIIPIMEQVILPLCPKDIEIRSKGGVEYIVKNPRWWQNDPKLNKNAYSSFHLIGCREDAFRHRGKRSDGIFLDECRDIDNFQYIADSVFGPHFITKKNPVYIMAGTPPESMAHPFISRYVEEAAIEGRHLCIKGSENKDFSKEEDDRQAKLFRGRHTTAYKREIECAHISEESALAVPEWQAEDKNGIKKADKCTFDERGAFLTGWDPDNIVIRPTHYFPFSMADLGQVDYLACIFSYWDFLRQKLVVVNEYVDHRKNTKIYSENIKRIELMEFGNALLYDQMRRWCDNDPQLITDFRQLYDYQVSAMTEKTDKWAMLAELRAAIDNEYINISIKCKHLLGQLCNGLLRTDKDGSVKDYKRQNPQEMQPDQPILGHCDALVALCYLWKKVQPYRQNKPPGLAPTTWGQYREERKKTNHASDNRGNVVITKNAASITKNKR